MRKDTSSFQIDPDNTAAAAQARPDVTRRFDTIAGELLGVAERSGEWVQRQIRSGLDEFVSRIFGLGETSPQPGADKEPEREAGRDR
jgi:hypothetical protein